MAARKTQARLVAATSFTCDVKGVEHFVHAGDVVPANSPLVKGRERLFVDEAEHRQEAGRLPRTEK
jgi:hypothetical protein